MKIFYINLKYELYTYICIEILGINIKGWHKAFVHMLYGPALSECVSLRKHGSEKEQVSVWRCSLYELKTLVWDHNFSPTNSSFIY